VSNADGEAKFNIEPDVVLIFNKGIKPKDIRLAEAVILENRDNFINLWKEFFRDGE
jgi:hypothetical protein